MMSIQEMALPTAVQVHGIRGLNTTHLHMYFEDIEKDENAHVGIKHTENDDCIIVEYQSTEGTVDPVYGQL